jgi:hypothetical protein
MCRARPGPRCSNGGIKRHDKAVRNLDQIQQRYDRAVDDRGEERVPKRLKDQLKRAELRLNAAQNVFWATPQGQENLRENITNAEATLATYGDSAPAPRTAARAEYTRVQRALTVSQNRLREGISRRSNSYSDLAMVSNERSALRKESLNRGGEMGSNAHPLRPETAEARRETAGSLNIREWEEADVERASTWVETGANPNFVRNPRVRPFSHARDENGSRVQVGTKVEGEEPYSKVLRLNTPDGQVVEGRHDFHLTKNDAGQYVVSVRSTVAASWEDSAPIDVTQQGLGHILADGTGIGRAESKMVVGTYTSKRAAIAARTQAKRDFQADKVTALMGRDTLASRAGTPSRALQRRGIVVWHRYANTVTADPVATDND